MLILQQIHSHFFTRNSLQKGKKKKKRQYNKKYLYKEKKLSHRMAIKARFGGCTTNHEQN